MAKRSTGISVLYFKSGFLSVELHFWQHSFGEVLLKNHCLILTPAVLCAHITGTYAYSYSRSSNPQHSRLQWYKLRGGRLHHYKLTPLRNLGAEKGDGHLLQGWDYIPNFTVLHCSCKTVYLHCAPKSPKPHNQSTFILLETFRPDRTFSIQLLRRLWSIVLGVEHEKMQTFSIAFLGRSTSTGWSASRHRLAQPRNQSPSS